MKKRLWALFVATIMMFIPTEAFGKVYAADADQDTFYIAGHNKEDIVTDSFGNTIPGFAYCLDGNAASPYNNATNRDVFTRIRLSEAVDYQKPQHYPRVFSDDMKSRLLKAVIAKDEIQTFIRNLDLTEHKQWFVDNIDALYANKQLSSGRDIYIRGGDHNYEEVKDFHDRNLITDAQFETAKWQFADGMASFTRTNYQYVIWGLVHGQAEWDQWVRDDGRVTGSNDRYNFEEVKTYYEAYTVDNPIPGSEEHSLFNVVYKPLMDYIDTQLPDYAAEGWDAWVYYTDSTHNGNDVQNILGAAFKDVTITKVDANGKGLSGAKFELYDANGNMIDSWESDGTAHILKNVYSGNTYSLRETTAPDGYATSAGGDIEFYINSDYDIETNNSALIVNGREAEIANDESCVKVSKVDITSKEELAGAHISVIDSNGDSVYDWVSDENEKVHEIIGLSAGTYTLREDVAPEGYTITTDVEFTLNMDGTVTVGSDVSTDTDGQGDTVILIEDSLTSFKVSKVQIDTEDELAGAELKIFEDGSDTPVKEWISGTAPEVITGLKTETDYILRETSAPAGYDITSEISFRIAADGTITVTGGKTTTDADGNTIITVEDSISTASIRISKTDISGEDELEGAHLQVIDAAGNVVEEWDSTDKPHEINGLIADDKYILRETVAPAGYTITTDISFSVAADGTITTDGTVDNGVLLIKDELTKIYVSKVDIANEKELEGAHLQVIDFAGNVVEEWDSTTDKHLIEGLVIGESYTLRETVAPTGYDIATDISFTIGEDGKVKTSAKVSSDGVLLVEDTEIITGKVISTPTNDSGMYSSSYPGSSSASSSAPSLVQTIKHSDRTTDTNKSTDPSDSGISENAEDVAAGAGITDTPTEGTASVVILITIMLAAGAVCIASRKKA